MDNNNYRLSIFTIRVDLSDGILLYNTATGSVVRLDQEEDFTTSAEDLIKLHFLTPADSDEFKWLDDLRQEKKARSPKTEICSYTIFTTMLCNARCFYCYEKDEPKMPMSQTVAHDIVEYIDQHSQSRKIKLRWFGGEPLMNIEVIDIICDRLLERGITIYSSMVSNGYLFDEQTISKAVDLWKLKSIQITLDGTKSVYEKVKSYQKSSGSEFDRVIRNIDNLLNAKIRVTIRLNQDLYNTEDLIQLVDYLASKFKGKKGFRVYNHLLFTNDDKLENTEERINCFLKLQELIRSYGLLPQHRLEKSFSVNHCMADNDTSVVINPLGQIGKCEHFPFKHLVGSIYSQMFDEGEIENWKKTIPHNDKCYKCPLYPQCIRLQQCPNQNDTCSFMQCENKINFIRESLHKFIELSKS